MAKFSEKVAGTKYVVNLFDRNSQWYIDLMLDDNVEAEQQVTALTKRGISAVTKTVLKQVGIELNELQHDMFVNGLYKQAEISLSHEKEEKETDDEDISLLEIDTIKENIDKLVHTTQEINRKLEEMSQRITRLEEISSNTTIE